MSKPRETVITNCERGFLKKCLSEWMRLDGRSFDEFRPLKIKFGKDWGSVLVSLGRTCVVAQTTCEIQQPKSSRPSEGILNINIELNPLAAPHFEPGRQSELSVQLNRLLEKCIKDSKAVDLESLCIKTNEKVWALRVDINVVNHEGNILDCASIALLTSLAHFRRPDVTCDGEDFIIHNYTQRDPIVTVLHHYPICITYCIFNDSEHILVDPSLLEESCADAVLIISLNSFKELCGLHLRGSAILAPHIVLNTVSRATRKADLFINDIKQAVKADVEFRQNKSAVGFQIGNEFGTVTTDSFSLWQTKKVKMNKQQKGPILNEKMETVSIGKGSAVHVPGVQVPKKTWEAEDSEDDLIIIENPKAKIEVSDSEEDEVVILE